MCCSFFTSKNAGDGVTSSSRNCSTISVERPDLDAVARAPAEQGEVVDHRLGQVALGREVGHRHGVLALRELLATLVHEHRQVGEHLGPAEAERIAEQEVLGGAGHVVLAADHVGDAHLGVVEGVGEEEHRHAGGPQEHEVLDGLVLEGHLAAHQVGEGRWCRRRAPGTAARWRRPARGRGRGRSRRSPAGRRAPWRGPGSPRRCSRTSRRARRRAGSAAASRCASRLSAWNTMSPSHSRPSHRSEARMFSTSSELDALAVGVLDAQEHLAAGAPGLEPVEQRGAGVADVQVARGRGREAQARGAGGHRPRVPVGFWHGRGQCGGDGERRRGGCASRARCASATSPGSAAASAPGRGRRCGRSSA